MIADLALAAILLATAWLLMRELRAWWRPLPPTRQSQSGLQSIPFHLIPYGVRFIAKVRRSVPRWRRRQIAQRIRPEMKVALDLLVVALRAGHSLPTVLLEWPGALARTLGPGRWLLVPQVERVREDLLRGATAEEALGALAERLDLEEMRMLARVVLLARRRGSDLSEIVARAAQVLAETLDVKSQMVALTAGKRLEGLILTLLPPLMLGLLFLVNPTYVAPLIETTIGQVILAIVLVMEVGSIFLGRWLLQGDV